ncbi:MAG: M3 family oligoendopeptidase [Actinomycetota bacterium]
MTTIFPGLDSAELASDIERIGAEIEKLKGLLDAVESGRGNQAEDLGQILSQMNDLLERTTTVNAYIYSFVTTEAHNDLAQAKHSMFQSSLVELNNLENRLTAWIGSLDVERLIQSSAVARQHSFFLRKSKLQAQHLMGRSEEELAASLSLSGIEAWSKLHSNVTSLLEVEVAFPNGDTETLPMSKIRALAHDPDEARRKAAYEAELKGWEKVEIPLAAALNGIKGAVNTLNERRSWGASIEPSLFINNTDIQTLKALQTAVAESFPDFRRYLKAKARLLGKENLPWWDLYAPVVKGGGVRRWSYDEAAGFIEQHFGAYSERLSGLASRAFVGQWIDAEPRDGKAQGGYCMTIRGDQSRVMVNFEPSFDALQTLAHELGHAYHHFVIAEKTPLQRKTPMALAETASTFCQAIVFNAALEQASGDEKLAMLESSIQDSCSYSLDIHSRYLFEKAVFEGRQERDLSVSELKELMLDCQRQTYGGGLDQNHLHPYMWAAKIHYYLSDLSYYNWPYTFGMLFSFGLYRQFKQDPDEFRRKYDDLLGSTGIADAATLAAGFGIDVRSVDFWRSSLDVCRDRIRQFEALAG